MPSGLPIKVGRLDASRPPCHEGYNLRTKRELVNPDRASTQAELEAERHYPILVRIAVPPEGLWHAAQDHACFARLDGRHQRMDECACQAASPATRSRLVSENSRSRTRSSPVSAVAIGRPPTPSLCEAAHGLHLVPHLDPFRLAQSPPFTLLVAVASDGGRGPPHPLAEIWPPLGTWRRSRSDGRW
jgi:hypothetical protein